MKSKDVRRYCTCCGKKQYSKNMKEVYYHLLKKHFWHCQKCMSSVKDNLHFIPGQKDKYLLELFSGSQTVSRTAIGQYQYRTFTIDIQPGLSPALCTDISKLRLNQIPERKRIFAIWASFPCTYLTILNVKNHFKKIVYSHRKYYYIPVTGEAKKTIQLLEKTLWLIRSINPVYYFIENPRGALRHFPQMNFAPFIHCVSYFDFHADVYKPTDIFTNCPFLKLPKIKSCVGRIFPGSVAKMNDSFQRSIVPAGLVKEIFGQIERHHFGPT